MWRNELADGEARRRKDEEGGIWYYGDKQLGLGSNVPYSYTLDQVLGEDGEGVLQNIATFDAGWYHSLAADTNGTLWAWGKEKYGLCWDGKDLREDGKKKNRIRSRRGGFCLTPLTALI